MRANCAAFLRESAKKPIMATMMNTDTIMSIVMANRPLTSVRPNVALACSPRGDAIRLFQKYAPVANV